MQLTPEQKATVSNWVAAGDNLSAIQKKLAGQFKLTLTYMDVRFLVDDLDLTLKDAAPATAQTDLSKSAAPRGQSPSSTNPLNEENDDELAEAAQQQPPRTPAPENFPQDIDDDDDGVPPNFPEADPASTNVRVEVDNVTLIPGAVASGSVTFTDGVTGKWIVDQYGRPGFTQISQEGFRPSQADAQAFMQALNEALRKKGF